MSMSLTMSDRWARFHGRSGVGTALAGMILTLLFMVVVLVSVFYMPFDPNGVEPANRLLPPGAEGHMLGTDALGRDVASQLMAGGRTSLIVGAGSSFAALIIGTATGLVAASVGGALDDAIMRFADIVLAIPGIVLALMLAATLGAGVVPVVIALTLFFTPSFARVARASALRVLQENYIMAARLYGRQTFYILWRHVIPNISSILVVQFTLYFAIGILIEAGLSYLGAGVQRPQLSWGLLLKEAQDQVGVSGILPLWPGLTIALVVLGLNLLGDGLRDILDPRRKA